ncbi:MAG: hypothetical protein QXL19_07740 [Ignisphaera sp.]
MCSEKQIIPRSTLSKLKTKQLLMLEDIKKELIAKHINNPENIREINEIVSILEKKIDNLRSRTLYTYITMLKKVAKKYPEFEKMIPLINDILD